MPTNSPFALLVQTGPLRTIAGATAHPSQRPNRNFTRVLIGIGRMLHRLCNAIR